MKVKLTTTGSSSNITKFSIKDLLKNEEAMDAYINLQNELDEAEQGYYKHFGLPRNPRSRKFLIEHLQNEGEAVYMGSVEGSYVSAGLVLKPYGPHKVCSVTSVVVSKSLRGKGLGKQLMDYIVNDKSNTILHLNVNTYNPSGMKLYASVGFVTTAHSMYRIPK